MSGIVAWHFKASVSCYFPSYTVDSKEVLRALPVHLLNRARKLPALPALGDDSPVRDRFSRVQPYAPRTPSPLRQSMWFTLQRKPDEDTEDGNCFDNIGILCISKHRVAEPRRPCSNSDLRVQSHARKAAYTFAVFMGRPRQTRKVAHSFASPVRIALPKITQGNKTEKSISVGPLKLKSAAAEFCTLREELAKTSAEVRALHARFAKLEQMEHRSANIQKKLQEQHDRLENVFEAFVGEKDRRAERLRMRR